MTQTIEAIYDDGVLLPLQQLEGINPKSRVKITIMQATPAALPPATQFWTRPELADLAREQGASRVDNVRELVGDWPDTDRIEDFLEHIRRSRA